MLFSDGGVVAAGEDDDAAGHLEEDGAAEGVGEVGAAGDLSVVGHQDNVVGGEGFHDRSGELRAAGRKERHHRHFTADVERSLEGYVEIPGLVLHAGHDCGTGGLEVQDAADFRPFPHCPEVESGLHRGTHPVQ